jgi:hypothetical protein
VVSGVSGGGEPPGATTQRGFPAGAYLGDLLSRVAGGVDRVSGVVGVDGAARPRREEGAMAAADHNVSSRPPPVGFHQLWWSATAAADQRVLVSHRREVRVLVP